MPFTETKIFDSNNFQNGSQAYNFKNKNITNGKKINNHPCHGKLHFLSSLIIVSSCTGFDEYVAYDHKHLDSDKQLQTK